MRQRSRIFTEHVCLVRATSDMFFERLPHAQHFISVNNKCCYTEVHLYICAHLFTHTDTYASTHTSTHVCKYAEAPAPPNVTRRDQVGMTFDSFMSLVLRGCVSCILYAVCVCRVWPAIYGMQYAVMLCCVQSCAVCGVRCAVCGMLDAAL